MMFLLAANRMNRGFARIRQWLILAARTLAVAGLIFAIARPLGQRSAGILRWRANGHDHGLARSFAQHAATGRGRAVQAGDRAPAIVLSLADLGIYPLGRGRCDERQGDCLRQLGRHVGFTCLCGVERHGGRAQDAGIGIGLLAEATSPGQPRYGSVPTCALADWNADSGSWSLIRQGFESLPQSVRFHLLAYPDPPRENLTIRVTEARREVVSEGNVNENVLLLSLRLSRSVDESSMEDIEIPIQIEIGGARSEHRLQMSGASAEIKNHRVALPPNVSQGWGRVSIPSDDNNADNEFFFVFDEPPMRRVVIVSDDRSATRALEIAASVSADGSTNAVVEVLAADQLDSLALDGASLLLWQTQLPDGSLAPAIKNYLESGGQAIFLPPSSLINGAAAASSDSFYGVRWLDWNAADPKAMVDNWRGDQDLLAATRSGAGLPVGQLELSGYARLASETALTNLATVSGGDPLLARVPTARGGLYFCTASADPQVSTLAESGIVLFVAIQRAIERGQAALGNTAERIAGASEESTANWQQMAGASQALSTEYASQAGVYQVDERQLTVNRSTAEDQRETLADEKVDALFAGLPFARVDDQAGNLSGIVREIWRLFLIAMIVALLIEAALCLPRTARRLLPARTAGVT